MSFLAILFLQNDGTSFGSAHKLPKQKVLQFILNKVYNICVDRPANLNQYEPFSPSVYGETGYQIIETMLKNVPLDKQSTVIDLGSGVGQVVLQIAASVDVAKVYGIEKEDVPNAYAKVRRFYGVGLWL